MKEGEEQVRLAVVRAQIPGYKGVQRESAQRRIVSLVRRRQRG